MSTRAINERNLLYALLALNLALLFGFACYLAVSLHQRPFVEPTRGSRPQASPEQPKPSGKPARGDPYALEMARAERVLTFQDLETTNYTFYLHRLKQAGCPENHLRHIVSADVEELFAGKRLEVAIRHDFEWWRAEPQPIVASLLREKGRELAEQQRQLVHALLGTTTEVNALAFWSHFQLTGAVLGALSEKVHEQVQEICRDWLSAPTADPARRDGRPVAAARAREQLRVELSKILTTEQLEEFLIRYSNHATLLRGELKNLQPSSDEFRKVFLAVEPIDRELQMEFGSIDALAEGQRERYLQRRNEAVRQALAPERYHAYILARNEVH